MQLDPVVIIFGAILLVALGSGITFLILRYHYAKKSANKEKAIEFYSDEQGIREKVLEQAQKVADIIDKHLNISSGKATPVPMAIEKLNERANEIESADGNYRAYVVAAHEAGVDVPAQHTELFGNEKNNVRTMPAAN